MIIMIPWILIAVLVTLIILAVVAVIMKKKYKSPTDYYAFFVIGITWLPLGLVFKNPALWGMGLVFMAVGLAHKKDWKKNHKPWNKLTKEEKKIKTVIITILGILVLIGLAAFLLANYIYY